MTGNDPRRQGARGTRPDGSAPDRAELERALGVTIDPALLEEALTHRSYAYENGGTTNERLEWLGDSVLGWAITVRLFHTHPDAPEGQLSRMKHAVVSEAALAELARSLGIGRHIRFGRGELLTGGPEKSALLADTMEALIGAVHEQHGHDVASAMVLRLLGGFIERVAGLGAAMDWKTSLQELTPAHGLGVPSYDVTHTGPEHQKTHRATVTVGGVTYGPGKGCRSKKEAEASAAEIAYLAIQGMYAEDPPPPGPSTGEVAG